MKLKKLNVLLVILLFVSSTFTVLADPSQTPTGKVIQDPNADPSQTPVGDTSGTNPSQEIIYPNTPINIPYSSPTLEQFQVPARVVLYPHDAVIDPIVDSTVQIRWTAVDNNQPDSSLLVDVQYSFNGGAWTDLATGLPNTLVPGEQFSAANWPLTGFAEGNYQLRVIVTENPIIAGTTLYWTEAHLNGQGIENVGGRVSSTTPVFTLDYNLAPSISFDTPLAGATLAGNQIISWTVTDPDGDTLTSTLQYRLLGSTDWTDLTSAESGNAVVNHNFDTTLVSDGQYELRALVSDGVNAIQQDGIYSPSFVTINNGGTVGNLPPSLIITTPLGGEVFNNEVITLSWVMSDPEGGVVTVTDVSYTYDGVVPMTSLTVASDATSLPFDVTGLPYAIDYRFTVTVEDEQGLSTTVTSPFFTVANTNFPTVTLLSPSAGAILDDSVTVAWDMADSDQSESTLVAEVEYREVGSSTWTNIATVVGQESVVWDTTSLVDGQYELQVVVTDDDLQQAVAGLFGTSFVTLNNGNSQSGAGLPVPYRYDQIRMFSANTGSEFLNAGDLMSFTLRFENTFEDDIEDVSVVAVIPELGVRRIVGPFDIDQGDTEAKSMYLEIPTDAKSGEYVVKVTISDGDNVRVRYRTFIIN